MNLLNFLFQASDEKAVCFYTRMSHRDTNYTTFTKYVSYQSILNTLVTFRGKFSIAYTGDVSVDSFFKKSMTPIGGDSFIHECIDLPVG